jgi:tRNA nucleotidyltransferase/poly(A) polymerase
MSLISACATEDNPVDPVGPQEEVITEFYNETVNKMIDENYELVKANGYAELVIPASLYPKGMIKMPAADMEAMDYVIKAGHTAYVNGGAVRDGVMGKELHDVDFSTDATADELVAIVPNSHKTQAGKVEIAQAEHEGGIRTDMVPYQAMDIRLKGQPGVPESEYFGQTYSKNLIDDSYGRDLTINAVYYDYKTGDIIDFHGGLRDIREKIIRPPFEPNLAFTIDPQSILRAVRFAARYEFTIEENTAKAIETNLPKIEAIKPSLRRYVVMKGFCDKCAFRTYQYNVKYGVLGYLCPMLKDYIGNADYEDYLKTVFDYVDSQKAMEASLAYCILFMPPVMKELGDKEPTLENITAAFDKLEQGSGQDKLFWLEDYRFTKKDPMLIWRNFRLMTNDETLKDAALVNSLRKEFTFKSSLMLLNGMAKYDSSLQKYADAWSKDLPANTNLDNMEADYTAKDGEVLTGISEHALIIPDGATITLESAGTLKSIICKGDAKIILSKGTTNIINNEDGYGCAIQTMNEKTLTIDGEGALVAFGGQEGAGIGGNGNIVINNGTIDAYGGQYGAGIGSEMHSPCGDITINAGKIKAIGGDQAAGIGSGQDGECGKIVIKSTVKEVVAIAGDECENNIGAGVDGTCGEVTIEDKTKILDE